MMKYAVALSQATDQNATPGYAIVSIPGRHKQRLGGERKNKPPRIESERFRYPGSASKPLEFERRVGHVHGMFPEDSSWVSAGPLTAQEHLST